MVTIHNVSKYMQVVGCEAENSKNRDYKETKLNVQFAPVVSKVTQHTNTTNIQGKGKTRLKVCISILQALFVSP